MTGRRGAALVGGALAVGCGLAAMGLPALDGQQGGPSLVVLADALTAVSFAVAGAAVAWARPRNAIGWLLLLIGLCEGLADLATVVATDPRLSDGALRTGAAWLASWVWFPALGLLPTAVVALYPSGRAGSRARRVLVGAAVAGVVAVTAGFALVEDAADDIVPGIENPFAVHPLGIAFAVVGGVLLVPSVLLSLVDAFRRLWRAASPEREQLAWLLVTVLLAVAISYTPWVAVRSVFYLLVPVAIAVGVVRHRLLDLQVVVRRTLLFLGLTGLVVGVFAVSTAVLSAVVQGDTVPVAVTAALVAVGLLPARDLLQRGVDRLVYGDRRDPLRAVASLNRDVAEHDDVELVPQVLRSVAAAVRSPHVMLLDADGTALAATGAPADGEPLHLRLQVGGQRVGALQVAPRTARDGWSADDRRLLELLAHQVAVVVHAGRLNAELARSRDRVLEATSQERQRLHQELHDGLGPALTGIALGLEAAEVALTSSPGRTGDLLSRLRTETQAAGREVRRLVEGLRPAALERQDLGAALHAFVEGLQQTLGGRLEVALRVVGDVRGLDPEVDAAAYRIVTEAVTNVVRHSGARHCAVEVRADDAGLVLVVTDDGVGLPQQPRDGVGLTSMRRRVLGLGGT